MPEFPVTEIRTVAALTFLSLLASHGEAIQHTLTLANERMAGAFQFFSWYKTQWNEENIGVSGTSDYQTLCVTSSSEHSLWILSWSAPVTECLTTPAPSLGEKEADEARHKVELIFVDILFKVKCNRSIFKWQMDCSLALGKLMWGKWTHMVWKEKKNRATVEIWI